MSAELAVAVAMLAFCGLGYFLGYWKRQDEIDGLKRDVRAITRDLEQTEEVLRVQEQILAYRGPSTPSPAHPTGSRRLTVVRDA